MDKATLEKAVVALAGTYAVKSERRPEPDAMRDEIAHALATTNLRLEVTDEELNELVTKTLATHDLGGVIGAGNPGLDMHNRNNIARWFEIHLDDFDQTPASQLEPDVFFRHVYYETLFSEWFNAWGYEVENGEELTGVEGIEFIPDVYAQLETLHGRFQVAVTLFCDNKHTFRVQGMLENIEAFAPKGSEFGHRDIYLMVTPFKFAEAASRAIRFQTQEEDYFVVSVEGQDLRDLELSIGPDERRKRLQDLVFEVARIKGVEPF